MANKDLPPESLFRVAKDSWLARHHKSMLERAEMLLDSEISVADISEKSGVSRPSIYNYRNDRRDIRRSDYDTISRLASAYDQVIISKAISGKLVEYTKFTKLMDEWFTESKKSHLISSTNVDAIREVVFNDPILLTALFNDYCKDGVGKC